MQFCPKCGVVLVKKRIRFICPKCKRSVKGKVKIKTSEFMAEKTKVGLLNEKSGFVASLIHPWCSFEQSKNKP